ncbi:MAG: phage major capsid protein [Patescibacteria group bacterium]|jgi:HK97 family phage major capsid protein
MNEEQKKEMENLAGDMAKKIVAGLGLEKIADLSDKVEKLMAKDTVVDAKMAKILGGKDYSKDADKLTKEEKIVGFFHALVTNNEPALKALSEGTTGDASGYLLPEDFKAEIIRELQDIVVMRQLCRIVPMKRNTMVIPSMTSSVQVYWTAENATKTTTTAVFAQKSLTAYKMAAILYASDELIEDSTEFDIVNLITSLFAEAIAQQEEYAFTRVNGTTQPTGLDTARSASTIATITAVGQDFDDIINLEYALPAKYSANAVFMCNRATVKELRKLKDGNQRYIWGEPVAVGQPSTLHGYPLYQNQWLPNGHIYFGDFKRAYWIGDRGQMAVKVTNDSETAFTKDQTAIRVVERIGGAVVQGSALKVLTGF